MGFMCFFGGDFPATFHDTVSGTYGYRSLPTGPPTLLGPGKAGSQDAVPRDVKARQPVLVVLLGGFGVRKILGLYGGVGEKFGDPFFFGFCFFERS